MKIRNQYTELIRDFKIRKGFDPWIRYKQSDCSEEEKKELEDWLFDLLRYNGIPKIEISEEDIMRDLINLSEVNPYEVYQNNEFGYNLSGNLTLKEFFFDKMNNVYKAGHPSVNQRFNDDYQLRRTIKKSLTYSTNEMSIMSWIQLNGSGYGTSFRPATAKAIVDIFGKKDCKVIDSSSGYGARMMGAWAAGASEYVGTDPNTYAENKELSDYIDKTFGLTTKKTVLSVGSEDFPVDEYKGYFDIYLCSPPYFSTEKYSNDESQSWVKFKTYEEWIKGFYRQTIYNMCDCLKKDGVFAINIFEKIHNIKKLTALFLADKGFYIYNESKYLLRTMPGNTHKLDEDGNEIKMDVTRESYEPIWFAKHYSQLLKENLITEEQYKKFRDREIT